MVSDAQGMHALYGGVVPELASRAHATKVVELYAHLQSKYKWDVTSVDSVSIASQPGLPGSVTVGVAAAHTIWQFLDKPVIECHHIMGHVFSILLDRERDILQLPYLCLTVSGGHSDIYVIDDWWLMIDDTDVVPYHDLHTKRWHIGIWDIYTVWPYTVTKLVQTLDDAVGEAYDKVAKMLWWPYPGWPWIDQLSQQWSSDKLIVSRIRKIDISDQFSFSGVKAQVHSLLEYLERNNILLTASVQADIARRFQGVVTDALMQKMTQYIDTLPNTPKVLWVVGGVSANSLLRTKMSQLAAEKNIALYYPNSFAYCTDNAAMIGVVGLLEK